MTNMREILQAGDGWLPIVNQIDMDLERLDPGYKILQVKEKFGGLRYYFTATENAPESVRAEMQMVVEAAEALADKTCEECGATETAALRIKSGWWRTLCDTCEDRRNQAKQARVDAYIERQDALRKGDNPDE